MIENIERDKAIIRKKVDAKNKANNELLAYRAIQKQKNKRKIVKYNVAKIQNMDEVEKHVHARAHYL